MTSAMRFDACRDLGSSFLACRRDRRAADAPLADAAEKGDRAAIRALLAHRST